MLRIYYTCGERLPAERLTHSASGDVRRADSVIWRLLLDRALADLGVPVQLRGLSFSPEGKPLLADAALAISPTHTAGFVAVAVSDGCAVGLDAETKKGRDVSRLLRAAERWFTPRECARVREAIDAGIGAEEVFLRVWTAKEALVKRTGVGLRGLRESDSDCPNGCELLTHTVGETVITIARSDASAPEWRQIIF